MFPLTAILTQLKSREPNSSDSRVLNPILYDALQSNSAFQGQFHLKNLLET
jgi:hypothetical protein